jgi:hypothetical protein
LEGATPASDSTTRRRGRSREERKLETYALYGDEIHRDLGREGRGSTGDGLGVNDTTKNIRLV